MRFWISWFVAEEDHRPLTYPPNAAVLGWWCTGYDASDHAILCGLIEAKTEAAAKTAVKKDWPGIAFRFVQQLSGSGLPLSDRFPLADWMRDRLAVPPAPPTAATARSTSAAPDATDAGGGTT